MGAALSWVDPEHQGVADRSALLSGVITCIVARPTDWKVYACLHSGKRKMLYPQIEGDLDVVVHWPNGDLVKAKLADCSYVAGGEKEKKPPSYKEFLKQLKKNTDPYWHALLQVCHPGASFLPE